MPQINQLSEIFFSQLFWLLVVFGIIYFGIGRGMVPKIQSTVDARDSADRRRPGSRRRPRARRPRQTEAAYRARMDASRARSDASCASEAKPGSAREGTEKRGQGRR